MSTINKGVEYSARQYYIHDSYTPIYYYTYLRLQKWIAENIFREDTSRVFMASDAYAFRRRFELTDMGKDFNSLDFASLHFPFANYWPQNTGWVGDKKLAGNTAALLYLGIYEGTTNIKAAASVIDIPTTFYFDREDDARLAYEILYFKSFNKHYYTTEVPFAGETLEIPVNMEISNVQFNPQFNETDWLKKQRIFVLKVTFKLYSFAITPPAQPYYEYQVIDGYICDSTGSRIIDPETGEEMKYEDYDGRSKYSIVEDVILNFGTDTEKKFFTAEGVDNFPEEGDADTLYIDSTFVPPDTAKGWEEPIVYRWNSNTNSYELFLKKNTEIDSIRVNGSVSEGSVLIDSLQVTSKEKETGLDTYKVTIQWTLDEETADNFSSVEIFQSNKIDSTIIDDPEVTTFIMTGLSENSDYYVYLDFKGKDGSNRWEYVHFTTPTEVVTQTTAPANSLIGTIW